MDKAMLQEHWPELKRLMEEGGIAAVMAYAAGFPEADELDLLQLASRKLYFQDWHGKTVDRYAEYANTLIRTYLDRADRAPDREQANKYRQLANATSYNLSADLAECWPGESPERQPYHFQMGLEAAHRSILLRLELNKDHISLSRAHWMAGAHHLALRQPAMAEQAFLTAYRWSRNEPHGTAPVTCSPPDNLDTMLCAGFVGLARWVGGVEDGQALYQSACDSLAETAGQDEAKKNDATFFADQFKHARSLYKG